MVILPVMALELTVQYSTSISDCANIDLKVPHFTNFLYLSCQTPVEQLCMTNHPKKCLWISRGLALCLWPPIERTGSQFHVVLLLTPQKAISSLVRHFIKSGARILFLFWQVHWQRHISLLEKKNQANFASYGPVNSKCFMKYYLNRSSSEMSGRPRSSIKVQHHKSGQSSISLKKREREKKKSDLLLNRYSVSDWILILK